MRRFILIFIIVTNVSFIRAEDDMDFDSILVEKGKETSLSLKIIPEVEKFKIGEPIHLTFTIENTGTNAYYILTDDADYSFFMTDCASNKKVSPPIRLGSCSSPDRNSFVLLQPDAQFTYSHPQPLVINEGADGNYWLHYGAYYYPAAKSGFVISGWFWSNDYPMDELYQLDDFKDIDQSVPLFRHGVLKSEVGYVYDGEYFRRKEVSSNQVKGAYEPTYINRREIKCVRFETQEDLFTYETDLVRIEVERETFEKSISEFFELHHLGVSRLLLEYLKSTKGPVKLECLNNRMRNRAEFRLATLLNDGKCQVYDLHEQEYIQSYVAAEWNDPTSAGQVFMFKSNSTVFFQVMLRL